VWVHYLAHPEVVTGRRLILFVALDTRLAGRSSTRRLRGTAMARRCRSVSARSSITSSWGGRAARSGGAPHRARHRPGARPHSSELVCSVHDAGHFEHVTRGALDAVAEHGRGLPLMRRLMDKVVLETASDGTIVRPSKRHRPDAASDS
jgi:hypothetical protein